MGLMENLKETTTSCSFFYSMHSSTNQATLRSSILYIHKVISFS